MSLLDRPKVLQVTEELEVSDLHASRLSAKVVD